MEVVGEQSEATNCRVRELPPPCSPLERKKRGELQINGGRSSLSSDSSLQSHFTRTIFSYTPRYFNEIVTWKRKVVGMHQTGVCKYLSNECIMAGKADIVASVVCASGALLCLRFATSSWIRFWSLELTRRCQSRTIFSAESARSTSFLWVVLL